MLASLGLFMSALDNMVVTTALPVLRVSLHASLSGLGTVNAYLLSFACMLLTGAALGDRFGRKRMFCIGLAVFTAASAWAALSPTVGVLIAARVVQGAGAAIIMPAGPIAWPPRRRHRTSPAAATRLTITPSARTGGGSSTGPSSQRSPISDAHIESEVICRAS